MKHHFADLLDRNSDYWSMVPNAQRFAYTLDKNDLEPESIKIITIGKGDKNWRRIFEFPNLEELTLHTPGKEQLASLGELSWLKRLRISHARPADIEFIAALINLEEVVFEYVSGFSDLSPISRLPKLKSLHLENLRRVRTYDGLKGLSNLHYLFIGGTVDWKQPIENFSFLEGLPELEVIRLQFVKSDAGFPMFVPLLGLKKLKEIGIGRATFPTREYAFLESAFPHVAGASWDSCWEYYGWLEFLGKGAGRVKCNSPHADEKREGFRRSYEEMKKEAEGLIKKLRQR